MSASGPRWLHRQLRRFLLGAGPLKRRSDRLQMIARLVVVLAFLVAPPLAVVVANATAHHLQTVATAQEAARHHGRAVLLRDAVTPSGTPSYGPLPQVAARASWTAPDGRTRSGFVLAGAGTRAGTTVPVWVDRTGSLVAPPLDRTQIPGTALSVALLPLFGVPTAAWALYGTLCAALDAHRQRRWAQGWAAVEPEWASRLR